MTSDVEQKLWKRVDKYLPVLGSVPFLKMACVCNNLAFGRVNEKSDIDLFVVARNGRLFTVRFLVTLFLHLCGVRRHGSKVTGRFCLSFFIDDSSLNLEKIAMRDDIYLAYWVKSMVSVLDDGIHERFLLENGWVDDFFEKKDITLAEKYILHVGLIWRFGKSVSGWILGGKFGDLVEWCMKKWQLHRAMKKVKKAGIGSSLIVDDHILKFHNIDRREYFRDRWRTLYGNGRLTKEKFLKLF